MNSEYSSLDTLARGESQPAVCAPLLGNMWKSSAPNINKHIIVIFNGRLLQGNVPSPAKLLPTSDLLRHANKRASCERGKPINLLIAGGPGVQLCPSLLGCSIQSGFLKAECRWRSEVKQGKECSGCVRVRVCNTPVCALLDSSGLLHGCGTCCESHICF